RFRLNELLTGERLDGQSVFVEREESIVLLGGQSRLRLEPMREVRDATGDRPFLDDLGNGGCDFEIEAFAEPNGCSELGVDVLRELCAHLSQAEGVDAEPRAGWLLYAIIAGTGGGHANGFERDFA